MSVKDLPLRAIALGVPPATEMLSCPPMPRLAVGLLVPFVRVRCACATCVTLTVHWPGCAEPLDVVATTVGSLDVADMARNAFGSDSAALAFLSAERVLEKLEIIEDAD